MTVPFCFGLRISLRSNSAFSIFLQFIGKHLQRPQQRSKPQSFPSQTIQFASNNFWRSKLNTTREFEWKVFCNWNVAVFMFHFIDLFDSRAKSWAQNYSLGVYIIRILLVLCFRPQTILYNVFKFSATSNLLNTCRLQVATRTVDATALTRILAWHFWGRRVLRAKWKRRRWQDQFRLAHREEASTKSTAVRIYELRLIKSPLFIAHKIRASICFLLSLGFFFVFHSLRLCLSYANLLALQSNGFLTAFFIYFCPISL